MAADYDLLRLADVIKKTGLSESAIYSRRKAGTFPEAVMLGPRTLAWRSDEIQSWVEQQPRESEFPDDERSPVPPAEIAVAAKKEKKRQREAEQRRESAAA